LLPFGEVTVKWNELKVDKWVRVITISDGLNEMKPITLFTSSLLESNIPLLSILGERIENQSSIWLNQKA